MSKNQNEIRDEMDGLRDGVGEGAGEDRQKALHSILGNFLHKWGRWVLREIQSSLYAVWRRPVYSLPGPENNLSTQSEAEYHPALSLRITAALNLLNLPLFWAGVVIFIWLITEPVLRLLLTPELFGKILSISQPLVAVLGPAVVGYFTNWLAIKMLFHPRRPNAVWWGLIPARREDIIGIISDQIQNRLISPEIISDYLHEEGIITKTLDSTVNALAELSEQADFRTDCREVLAQLVSGLLSSTTTRRRIKEYLEEQITRWQGGTFSEKMIEWSKGIWGPRVIDEIDRLLAASPQEVTALFWDLEKIFPDFTYVLREKAGDGCGRVEETLTSFLPRVLSKLQIKEIIRRQLQKFNEEELEQALTGNVQRELVFIQTSGGVFGLLVGLAILYPYLRLVFLGVALGLWMIYRLTRT